MMLYICSKYYENIFFFSLSFFYLLFQSFRIYTIFILNITKENNSEKKIKMKLRFLFAAHCLIKFYICTKFHETILDGFKVIERTRFSN